MPVTNLGITGDGTTLTGAVKLSPGSGITLTRVDADNAIRIDGAAAGPQLTATLDQYAAILQQPPPYVFTHA